MHMVIGLVLASLLKRRKKTGLTLPIIRGKFEAVHALPGRLRFRVPLIENQAQTGIDTLRNALSKIPEIKFVELCTASGSILIQYDPERIAPHVVCGILIKMLGLESALDAQPVPAVEREMRMIGSAVNHTVYNSTAGALDLTSAAILVMISVGVYKIILQKDRSLPSGINLLWWAYVMAKGRKQ